MVRGYNVGGGDAMGGSRRSVAIVMLTSPVPVPSSRTRTGALEGGRSNAEGSPTMISARTHALTLP